MRLHLDYSASLESGAFVQVTADVNSEDLTSTVEFLDEHLPIHRPADPGDLDFGQLFAGDPDFGGTINIEGSDPTD